MNRPILVGIDRSETAKAALEWAAREAALRQVPLRLLHAFSWPLLSVPIDPRSTSAWSEAEQLVADCEARAARIAPGIEITGELSDDHPSAALLKRAADAGLVVVGTRGHGGFAGLIIGSTALQVAGHSTVPVVVVGERRGAADGDIVLGVGTEPADALLAAAFEQAALYGAALRAVHAVRSTETDLETGSERSAGEDRINGLLATWRTKHPEVTVTVTVNIDVVEARARHALIEASGSARLVVLGSREHPGFTTSGLGSVTHAVIHNSRCPVLIA